MTTTSKKKTSSAVEKKTTVRKANGTSGTNGSRKSPAVAKSPKSTSRSTPRQKTIVVTVSEVSRDDVARRAWEIWQAEGCPDGKSIEHWLRAEEELTVLR